MKESVYTLLTYSKELFVIGVPALLGGVVDYFNQVYNGKKHWTWIGFIVHLTSAVFFGMVCGVLAQAYAENSQWLRAEYVSTAAAAMGGFLGVRIADMVVWRFLKADRRRD